MNLVKPKYTEPCNHCGLCCHLELCAVAKIAHPGKSAPCPSLIQKDNEYFCGMVLMEQGLKNKHGSMIAKALGIGTGCSMPDEDTTDEEIEEFDLISKIKVFGHA